MQSGIDRPQDGLKVLDYGDGTAVSARVASNSGRSWTTRWKRPSRTRQRRALNVVRNPPATNEGAQHGKPASHPSTSPTVRESIRCGAFTKSPNKARRPLLVRAQSRAIRSVTVRWLSKQRDPTFIADTGKSFELEVLNAIQLTLRHHPHLLLNERDVLDRLCRNPIDGFTDFFRGHPVPVREVAVESLRVLPDCTVASGTDVGDHVADSSLQRSLVGRCRISRLDAFENGSRPRSVGRSRW
jgi:hypothetical protein